MRPPVVVDDPLLSPGDVAKLLSVHSRTVTRWRVEGLIEGVRLPSGHFRFRRSVVDAILLGKWDQAS